MQHIQFVGACTIDHTQDLILKLMLNTKMIALHGEGGSPLGLDPSGSNLARVLQTLLRMLERLII